MKLPRSKEAIAVLIKRGRAKKGLTQQQLADKCDLSLVTIEKLENGLHVPPLSRVIRVLEALDVEVILKKKSVDLTENHH